MTRRARRAGAAPAPSPAAATQPTAIQATIPRRLLGSVCGALDNLADLRHRTAAAGRDAPERPQLDNVLAAALAIFAEQLDRAVTAMRVVQLDTPEKAATAAALRQLADCWTTPGPDSSLDTLLAAGGRLRVAADAVPANHLLEALEHPEPAPWRPEGPEPTPSAVEIVSLGDLCYQVGEHDPVTVSENEDNVLQAFLAAASMNAEQLVQEAGFDRAPRVLGNLRTRYGGILRPAIRCPGRKGGGGYHVRIRRAD
jgi:hypothetical protein